jgi:ABC-2 type transport system ATP-binding protein
VQPGCRAERGTRFAAVADPDLRLKAEPKISRATDGADRSDPYGGRMETVIETKALTKRFGERAAVDGVDLTVGAGVAFGFLGPNGAGKTTMIRTLLGLTRATAGEMSLLGLPQPAKRREALARVGAIVEEPRFHPHLTGRENLQIVAAARDSAADGRIDESIERVGLSHRAGDRVKTYSLGMRQRLGIARCLLADPALLMLDEPMNGLDPAGILEMRHLIRAFVAEGRTVFLSSHLLDEVEKTCDEVAIVDRGRVILQGRVDEIAASGDPTVLLDIDDAEAARRVLSAEARVTNIEQEGRELRITLGDGLTSAEVNRALVIAGVAVSRLEPARATLEEKFLAVTSRLETSE